MTEQKPSVDAAEIAKFDALAQDWWNPHGAMKPLHQLNPLRMQYIQDHVTLANQKILDVGCGGGILSEALARRQAAVTGIDLSTSLITIARQHAQLQGLTIDYQHISSTELAAQFPGSFDVITCMELLEHVPDPSQLIQECAQLLKPGGFIFFATINRNVWSFLGAVIGAEYVLQLLPKGTHQFAKFIRPSELTLWTNRSGLTLKGLQGITYNPITGKFRLSTDVTINYLAYYQRTNTK